MFKTFPYRLWRVFVGISISIQDFASADCLSKFMPIWEFFYGLNVQVQGLCMALSRSVPCSAGLAPPVDETLLATFLRRREDLGTHIPICVVAYDGRGSYLCNAKRNPNLRQLLFNTVIAI